MDRRNFLMASAMAAPMLGASAATASADENHRRGVTTGADQLAADGWRRFAGRKVGILTNPTGV
ncbi:MAG: DUF1343 domain-containing protein, partial [Actinomycetota bacterium]|nr:DUF1343 domain-containing protein [Actinomycetota bacterium]